MRPYMRFNRGYHYILTVIDVLSKHARAEPLKAKSGNEGDRKDQIRNDGRCPKDCILTEEKNFTTKFYNNILDVQKLEEATSTIILRIP